MFVRMECFVNGPYTLDPGPSNWMEHPDPVCKLDRVFLADIAGMHNARKQAMELLRISLREIKIQDISWIYIFKSSLKSLSNIWQFTNIR